MLLARLVSVRSVDIEAHPRKEATFARTWIGRLLDLIFFRKR